MSVSALGALRRVQSSPSASSVTCYQIRHAYMKDRYILIRSFFHSQASVPQRTTRPPISCLSSPSPARFNYPQNRCFNSTSRYSNSSKRQPPSGSNAGPHSSEHTSEEPPPTPSHVPHSFENYSVFFRRLAQAIPHQRPPTKEDFLNAANGFWQRSRVRLKWLFKRSFRRFNTDDMSAFVTWIIMTQAVWIFVGTTTFFSVIFATLNSLRLQNFVAQKISDYLSSNAGVRVVFESAVVPKWKDSKISFKHVYVSRRPASADNPLIPPVSRSAGAGYDVNDHPTFHQFHHDEDPPSANEDEDTNYTMFDLMIDSVDVTLSLQQWFEGKGLVKDAIVKGVRGILDRRNVHYDPENPLNPADFRHPSAQGDFELEALQLEDVLVTILQPGGFRPFTASIFWADLKTFRKRWMLFDALNAENIVGQFDNCLVSLHRPQSIGRTTERDLEDGEWARMSRIRIDGVNIDHLQKASGDEGPVAWIRSGQVDIVLDIKFPRETDDGLRLNELIEDLRDAISTSIQNGSTDPLFARIPGQKELLRPPLSVPQYQTAAALEEPSPKIVVDVDMRFRDIKADLPIFTHDISYINNALARPIVAFMNANRTLVPIRCRITKGLDDFDGAWTMWETGLLDELGIQIYEALAYHVAQANFNHRVKTVSYWSLQMIAQAALRTLRNAVEPMRLQDPMLNMYELGSPFESITL